MVFVDGEKVVEDGEAINIDRKEVMDNVQGLSEKFERSEV